MLVVVFFFLEVRTEVCVFHPSVPMPMALSFYYNTDIHQNCATLIRLYHAQVIQTQK